MNEPSDIEVYKLRLNEAQAVSNALRNDLLLEREVSQELARRNDCLQKDLFGSEERMRSARISLLGLEATVKSLSEQIDSTNLANKDAPISLGIKMSLQNCLDTCQGLQKALLTRVELAVEAEKAEQAAAAALRAIQEARDAEEAKEAAAERANSQIEAVESKITENQAHELPSNKVDILETISEIPVLEVAKQHSDEEASQEDFTARSSDGEEISRNRSASTAGNTRPRNMSIGGRRNSSIFVRLPDLAGTSLIRKSSDITSASHVNNMSMNVGSGDSDMDLHTDDSHLPPLPLAPLTPHSQAHSLPSVHSPIPHSSNDSHSESFVGDEANDFSMDLNYSRYHANESVLDPLETSACADVALFEHFIVVGASEQVAIEFAHQLQLSYDENTLSTMFKNTFGGFFNANRFGGNNAASGNTAINGVTSNISSSVANTAAAATANSLLSKQKTALLGAGLLKPSVEDIKSEKLSDISKSDRRLSFGRNAPPPVTPTPAVVAASAVGTAGVADNSTPVRNSGVFSYFMRSPSGTVSTTGATTTASSINDTPGSMKKTPLHTQKSTELDSIAEYNESADTPASRPKIIVPSRGFIYGDDSSEHGSLAGSNSSHASSDLLSAAAGGNGDVSPANVPFAPSVGPLKLKTTVRSGSTPVDEFHPSTSHSTTPTTTHPAAHASPHILPSNLTDMINMEDPASPAAIDPPVWMQGFGITEIDTTSDMELFGHSKVFSSDPISPMNGYDLETQPSMKDNNTMGGTFDNTNNATSGASVPSTNPGHLPPPKSDSQWYGGMMSTFYGTSTASNTTNSSTSGVSGAPPIPPVAPLDSPPKLSTHGKFFGDMGSTKSTVTDESDSSSYFGSPSSKPSHTLNSLALPHTKAGGGAEDVFVRGRMRSSHPHVDGGSDPNSPQAPRLGRSVSSEGPIAPILPTGQYTSNTEVAARIVSSDKKAGTATTQAEILYRYPYTVEPPPTEVSDFCMPLGGKIAKLAESDSGTMVQEILFGHSHSKRSSRCFIFLLEDKTLGEGDSGDEESGRGTNKLYGVCVLHPRLVKTPIQNTKRKNPLELNKTNTHGNVVDMSQHGSYNGTAGLVAESEYIEFESMVCYAFLTRFPLFDFFFQVIFDLINTERLTRMELAAEHTDSDLHYSRSIYEYLPTSVLEEVLARLTKLPPPVYNEKFQFHISPGIKPVESVRIPPPPDFSEHYLNSSEWALPTLLSWMPVESIVWALSLLLGEAKIVVIGHDYGMVSCAVIGLLVLLRPLDWVSPVIPMLPIKLMDFVESPVPILVGITVSSRDQTVTVEKIFDKNSDPSNDGLVLAVLDVSKRELFMDIEDKPLIPSLCMPGADSLAKSLKDCLTDRTGTVTINSHASSVRHKPVYTASVAQKLKTRAAHDITTKHIRSVAAAAVAHQQKLLDRRKLVIEMANRMSSPASPDVTRTVLERQSSFGSADNDVSDDDEDVSRKEATGGIYGHGRTTSVASASSTSSNNMNALIASSNPAPVPAITTSATTTVAVPAPTAASSMAAAFGKVLRPRNSNTTEIDTNSTDRAKVNPMAPVAANAAKMVDAAKNALQIPPPGPPSKLVNMSKMPLEGNNTEEFLNRFILTQIFSEHMYRQGMLDKPAPPVPAHPAPPVAPPLPSSSPPSSYAAAVSGVNSHTVTYADAASHAVHEGDNACIANLNVNIPNDMSPESVGSTRKSVRMSGQFSPLSDGSTREMLEAHEGPTAEALALLSHIESTPRNNIEMRRRSVDMGFRRNSKNLSKQDEDSGDDEEEE